LDLRELADEDLMVLIADGQARGFEIVLDRHGGAAFSLAYRICGRRGVAEDVVLEAFLLLRRTGVRYDRVRGSVRSWLLTVVHDRAIVALRSGAVHQGRHVRDEGFFERMEAPGGTEAQVARREEAREVRGALDELPTEQRNVIELAHFGGFTHTEIASLLSLPVGTVKGRMRSGLARLSIAFDDPADVVA
jgi:RNA polymerase sigma-70 factor, ECF subfamily